MGNKTTNDLLKAWYTLPGELRERFNTSGIERLLRMTSMDPKDILARAEKVIEYWTEDKMNEYLAKYTTAVDPINSCMYDLDWVDHNTNTKEQIEICLQVYRLFKRVGIEIRLYQAYFIWCYVTNNTFTNTPFLKCDLMIPKRGDTDCWGLILESFIFGQSEELEREIFKNEQ